MAGNRTWSSDEKKERFVVDFFTGVVDEKGIPKGWVQEKEPGAQSKIAVGQEKEFPFVNLLSVNDGFGIKKEFSIDIRKYPYLTWRWKATRLPKGGDIRKRETDDQAGQIYVLFPRFPAMINTRSTGYIWDALAGGNCRDEHGLQQDEIYCPAKRPGQTGPSEISSVGEKSTITD